MHTKAAELGIKISNLTLKSHPNLSSLRVENTVSPSPFKNCARADFEYFCIM